MTTGSKDGAMALARKAMDAALIAPSAVRIPFLDAAFGSADNAKQATKTWTSRIYAARSHMRQVQARAASPNDLISGMTREAADPDSFRTAYDALYCAVERRTEDDGWWLYIRRADTDTLAMEVL